MQELDYCCDLCSRGLLSFHKNTCFTCIGWAWGIWRPGIAVALAAAAITGIVITFWGCWFVETAVTKVCNCGNGNCDTAWRSINRELNQSSIVCKKKSLKLIVRYIMNKRAKNICKHYLQIADVNLGCKAAQGQIRLIKWRKVENWFTYRKVGDRKSFGKIRNSDSVKGWSHCGVFTITSWRIQCVHYYASIQSIRYTQNA